jgi:hypothetical protein
MFFLCHKSGQISPLLSHFMIPSPIMSTFDENFADGTEGDITEPNHWLPSPE